MYKSQIRQPCFCFIINIIFPLSSETFPQNDIRNQTLPSPAEDGDTMPYIVLIFAFRKPGLSLAAFKSHYEQSHVPLIANHRRFTLPENPHATLYSTN